MRKFFIFSSIILAMLLCPVVVKAKELSDVSAIMEEMDFSGVDQMLADEGSELTLEGLIDRWIHADQRVEGEEILQWICGKLFHVFYEWKSQSTKLLILLLVFVLLHGMAGVFEQLHLTDFCFFVMYVLLLYQLFTMACQMQSIVGGCLDNMEQFLILVQPLMCAVLMFSSGLTTSNLTYELLLLVLYLITHIFTCMIPVIFLYLLVEFANYAMEKQQLSHLAALLSKGVLLVQKLLIGGVVGINVLQGLISPSVDLVRRNTVVKTMGVLPGVGGAVRSVGELLIGTGLLIKNCVGAAVLVALGVIFAGPLLELAMMALFYKLLAAVVQPLTDARVSGVLSALSGAGRMYLLVCFSAVLIVFLSVAVICVMTGTGS